MVSVKVEHVTKYFGKTKILDDISFEVKSGELFFLVGPSGCGKTTLLRTIAGFYFQNKGSIYFDSKKIDNLKPNKRNTAMVFQNYALWPHMNIEKNVQYGLDIKKLKNDEKRKKVNEVLETVKMLDLKNRRPQELSGGQQQRVALARALVVDPDVLLLDEPLSNLDAKLRLEMRQEIKRIHLETGITSIYVTHDQKEALSLASRIAIMNCGKIEQIGTPREIYENPVNKFVAGFIGETNFIEGIICETNESIVIIETSVGKIISKCKTQKKTGEKIICSLRFEAIEICNKKNVNTENQFEAKIEHISYLGESEQYDLKLSGQVFVKATAYTVKEKINMQGSMIVIKFNPENVILLGE